MYTRTYNNIIKQKTKHSYANNKQLFATQHILHIGVSTDNTYKHNKLQRAHNKTQTHKVYISNFYLRGYGK